MQQAWDAPALDPAMLKALVLILVELMIVTAIALFFSTFSTPMLSAAFTFGLFVVGHFSADLRNFEQVVDSPAAATLARGLYWVLPNLAQFDVKAQVVHAQPVPLGYMALTGRLRGALHRGPARGGDGHFFPSRFQMKWPAIPSSSPRRSLWLSR